MTNPEEGDPLGARILPGVDLALWLMLIVAATFSLALVVSMLLALRP